VSRAKSSLVQTKVFLPPDLVRTLDERARRLGLAKSEIARLALTAWLAPESPGLMEDALGRRLDRVSRQLERLERGSDMTLEALGLFIRAWLTATPPAPEGEARLAMEAKGRERYQGFIAALGRRLASGRRLDQDLPPETSASPAKGGGEPQPGQPGEAAHREGLSFYARARPAPGAG
jgi:hypothetical protein